MASGLVYFPSPLHSQAWDDDGMLSEHYYGPKMGALAGCRLMTE